MIKLSIGQTIDSLIEIQDGDAVERQYFFLFMCCTSSRKIDSKASITFILSGSVHSIVLNLFRVLLFAGEQIVASSSLSRVSSFLSNYNCRVRDDSVRIQNLIFSFFLFLP